MLKFKENDIAVHCITGREYLVISIRENKCGQRVVELIGHKCNIVRDIKTDENGDEHILDEVKLTGGVVEEVRIVPVGNEFTLEGLCATRYGIPKAQLVIADIPYNLGANAYGSNPIRESSVHDSFLLI